MCGGLGIYGKIFELSIKFAIKPIPIMANSSHTHVVTELRVQVRYAHWLQHSTKKKAFGDHTPIFCFGNGTPSLFITQRTGYW